MRRISADLIITNVGDPISNGIIIYNETSGVISDIIVDSSRSIDGVQHYPGIIVPGYVNAHCHLELSHLRGVIGTGTGLIPFIKGVVTLRDFPQEQIDEEIYKADRFMHDTGIVAVGDISNKVDTARVKNESSIRYYTFVEMFDFLQEEQAQSTYEQYKSVYDQQASEGHNRKSFVPHAPYSVSTALFEYVNSKNEKGATISIHNQELSAENQLFIDKTGEFLDFYDAFGISLDRFSPQGKSSIHYTMKHLRPDFKTLMVHNTKTTKDEIVAAQLWNKETYWVTCPNANLYIENSLPRYRDFIDSDGTMCIGTDSLSSNWQLSIFEEMKTIKRFQSGVADLDIIKWATANGATALGYDDLGRLEVGLSPGINWIDVAVSDNIFDLSEARRSVRIA